MYNARSILNRGDGSSKRSGVTEGYQRQDKDDHFAARGNWCSVTKIKLKEIKVNERESEQLLYDILEYFKVPLSSAIGILSRRLGI